MAFSIANIATPTSAKTASHIVAKPPAPSISTAAFTVNAKPMFCQTIQKLKALGKTFLIITHKLNEARVLVGR